VSDDDNSSTVINSVPKQLKPFVKGDPRINRLGRPKSFDALRELARQIADEPVMQDGKRKVVNGHAVTVAEAILRTWAGSKDARLQQAFIEIAYGKVPDKLEISTGTLKMYGLVSPDDWDDDVIPTKNDA
jgi:hypothetical protein